MTSTIDPKTNGKKKEAASEQAALIRAIKGKYANVPTSSEEFAERKEKTNHEEHEEHEVFF